MNPLLNILIRHKQGREDLLRRCLKSIVDNNYPEVRVIVSAESEASKLFAFSITLVDKVILVPEQHYNLHCNDLKKEVTEGYFMYVDDDDYFRPGALHALSVFLDGDGLIVQFNRNGHIKPSDSLMKSRSIIKGLCGGGCLVLHSKHKNVADWKGKIAGDFDYLKEVSEKVDLKFVPIVLQIAGNKGLKGK